MNLQYPELEKFREQSNNIRRLWNIDEKLAELLYMFVRIKKPMNILELGTSNGFSTFYLSVSGELTESCVYSIEFDEKRHLMAKENLKNCNNIELIKGRIEDVIPELHMNFDMVFMDANKSCYIDYILSLENKLNKDALIIADNVSSHEETTGEYIDYIKKNPRYDEMILPYLSGFSIAIYK